MKWMNQEERTAAEASSQAKAVCFLYRSIPGRIILKGLTRPCLSKAVGRLLDSRISCCLISRFIKANGISMQEYEQTEYRSFNDFFSRRIKAECRPVCQEKSALIAPCDSRLTVYDIGEDSRFQIKGRPYTMRELVRSERLARHYYGGRLLLFRLSVGDYHRYCYPDSGVKSKNYRIPGLLHTVHPIAASERPIYRENAREFSILKTKNFGRVLMMQVGAMLVGRIVNHHEETRTERGEEAGFFQYGGSTVIVCLEPGAAEIDPGICRNSAQDRETRVLLGEQIGKRTR